MVHLPASKSKEKYFWNPSTWVWISCSVENVSKNVKIQLLCPFKSKHLQKISQYSIKYSYWSHNSHTQIAQLTDGLNIVITFHLTIYPVLCERIYRWTIWWCNAFHGVSLVLVNNKIEFILFSFLSFVLFIHPMRPTLFLPSSYYTYFLPPSFLKNVSSNKATKYIQYMSA